METIDLADFEKLLRGNPGLLIGPGQTIHADHCADVQSFLQSKYSTQGNSLHAVVDSLIATHGATEDELRRAVADAFKASPPAPQLSQLAKIRWSAVLSASADLFLEHAMQEEEEKRPTRRSVYTAFDLAQPLPPRDIPVFKMVGSYVRRDFCLSTPAYLQRKLQWRLVVPTFIEKVAGNPVLCLGMAQLADTVLLEIVSEFVAGPTSAPSHLIFLADDPLTANQQLAALLGSRTKLVVVRASISQVVQSIVTAEQANFPSQFRSTSTDDKGYWHLLRFDDIATLVNLRVEPRLREDEKLALKELLFSPSVPEWDPFAYNIDFKRSLTAEVLRDFAAAASNAKIVDHAFVLTGTSASGKTTILKRVAFDVAKTGAVVLWHKPAFVPDPARRLRQLFDEIANLPGIKAQPVYYFIDDPVAASTSLLNLLAASAELARVRLFLVVGMKTSDWLMLGAGDLVSHFSAYTTLEVPDSLDDDEAAHLAPYLVDLEIAATLSDAETSCRGASARYTRDTLSLLYWLLPQTRVAITSSVQDELFRLGDTAGFRRMLLGGKDASPRLLREAYEMVAVSAHYDVPLPVEVLVSALGVDYQEWLSAAEAHGRAWGILYSVYAEDNSERYTTRNDVVTRCLVEAINGGSQLRGGELSVLRKLIASCSGHSGPVYREFCVRLLVPHDRLNRLDYQEGLALYDLAIASLSHPDQLLVHHKGLWIKNRGHKPIAAAAVLEEALRTPTYPYSDREEASEHIHTSLAATKLDAIDQGDLTWDQGKFEAIEHLQKARAQSFFNPRAVHVEARVATRIITKSARSDFGDACEVANRSLADIDRTLELIRSPVATGHSASTTVDFLESARQEVIAALANGRDLARLAEEIWKNFRSQSGFIVSARNLLQAARLDGRDKSFRRADDYCLTTRGILDSAHEKVSPEFAEVQLQICYEAYVVRRLLSAGHNQIDWIRMEQLANEAATGQAPARTPMTRFILAIARAHQGDWPSANAHFAALRKLHISSDMLWRPRALLLSEQGGPRSVQGKVREVSGERFLWIEELQLEVKCSRRGRWPKDGEVAHAYVEFAFAGPTAIDRVS
jgi:hypothetical protein